MDPDVKSCRSLPPLVEGKVHGNLKLVIDEIVWIRRNPGDVTVVASWWGEQDSAQFRPIDGIGNTVITSDTTEIYDIKTNAVLFEDYIKNCEAIELVIVAEKIHEVIGTVHVGELSKILTCEPYSEFFPIFNNSGSKIGKIHVFLQLTYLTKLSNMQSKPYKYSKKHVDNDILSAADNLRYSENTSVTSCKNIENIKKRNSARSVNTDTFDTYRSVLKSKQSEIQVVRKKFNEIVTDKLVAQIVARAQRLRGAILKETYNEDSLALSDTSANNELYPDASVENDAKLYEYILGKKMTSSEERKALDILRSTSPLPSLIDLASETVRADKDDNKSTEQTEHPVLKLNSPVEYASHKETYTELNETHPFDYVDSIRIFIESFAMSPAGYRRAKSTCLQHDVPLTLMYFVQYNTMFRSVRQTDTKYKKDNKFIKTCAKKQMGRVIDFNSEGIYSIPRHILNKSFPLKFKLFVRHLNQKLPTELGCGSMNISDIVNTANLSSTRCIAIVNKGIKIGELKVTAELGCNSMSFGKQFVDTILSAKENIPILETEPTVSANNDRYRSATGTHSSKSSNKVSSVSAKRIECFANNNSNKDLISKENIMRHREQNLDNKKIDTSNPEGSTKDKVLLHGLIYVGEGKDLPESNTYLICRAFWREDKATSQICNNTKHPFYHFFQLVPLIHGTELLERIRDNHIIIEVYNRQNSGTDNLLGIAKLSVHQLYIAYRDPLVLPHLLLSKYPVISVDGWVNINDPISGKFCGELFALVALGTAEQIASLEMSRGLRNTSVASRTLCSHRCHVSDNMKYAATDQPNSQSNVSETVNLNTGPSTCDNSAYRGYNTPDRDLAFADHKTQESQTDISSLKNAAVDGPVQGTASSKHLALHTLVDRLANVLHINKSNTDRSAQTEINGDDQADVGVTDELRLNTLDSNSNLNDDSNSCSPGNIFQPTEMYRSVGVGAEYEESNQQPNNDNAYHDLSQSSVTEENAEKEEPNANCDSSFFRSVVEIECALHLPKIEGPNELLEPSTYVTFQHQSHKRDHSGQSNSYMMTNVFRHSCNPKWNWRCDAKLSTDLLLNNQKRLILKVWHLNDPDTSTEINLEKDTVIGFSAIDLSVLMAGFPVVSGWFHIMDLTGKCNGQIKISITPLDSLLPLRKFASSTATNLSRCSNLSQTNRPYPYHASYGNPDSNSVHQMVSYLSHNKDRFVQNDRKPNDFVADIGHGLEDISMSFLSTSLKQKLTELDQITKRLQSRLRDVTNTAFEDDIDNDFDMIELNSDNENTDDRNESTDDRNENTDDKNDENSAPRRIVPVYSANDEASQATQECKVQNARNSVNNEKLTSCTISSTTNPHFEPSSDQCRAVSSEATDAKHCSSSNAHFSQHPGYYHNQYKNQYSSTRDYMSYSNGAEYPVRGTRTHINHLLDKLSLDLPPRLTPEMNAPMKRDILQLFAALREHKNNSQVQDKSARAVNTCSVNTAQVNNTDERQVYSHQSTNSAASDTTNISESSRKSEVSQPSSRISTVIREELVAEENNDSVNCDELTTYLLTSNIRHLDLDNIINPLLYQHLIPDLQVSSAESPEVEAVKQLDNRYSRSFNAAMCSDRSARDDISSRVDTRTNVRTNVSGSEVNTELFPSTPSSRASENANDSIDITVICKSANELMLSNNVESQSSNDKLFDKLLMQQVDGKVEDCSGTSELSFPGASRQAPEGGNPVEEVKMPAVTKQRDTRDDAS